MAKVGSAEFELRATRDKLKQDIAASEADLKAATGRMERDAGAAGERVGGKMSGIAKGVAIGVGALVAAFTAALALAIQFGGASLRMAETLSESARRIGVTTTALQEFQYVARKTGEDANAVSPALETFGNKLAQAAAGLSKSDLDNFRALGFTQEQLRSFKDTESGLEAVLDRIGELASEADRAAIAEKLGLGPLAASLREGSDETARLRDEARDLGFVLDDAIIQKGADAQGQLEDLAQVIGVQMAAAFIDLSDEVIAFAGHVADAITALNRFTDRYSETRQRMVDEGYRPEQINPVSILARATEQDWVGNLPWNRRRRNAEFPTAMREARALPDYADTDDPAFLRTLSDARLRELYGGRIRPENPRTGLTPVTRPDRSGERAAEQEARRAERVAEEIARLKARELSIAQDDLLTVQQRYELRQRELEIAREGEDADLRSRLARKDLTQANFEEITAQNEINRGLEDRIAADVAFRDIQDERLAQERVMTDLTADLLSLQSGAARTAKERQEIELRLLALAQQRARDELARRQELDPNLSPTEAARQREALGAVQSAQTSAARRSNMSPLEQWRDQSLRTAAEVDEAYEAIAARGLDSLNDGIVDAIVNSRNLGEVFSNVSKQIIADLAAIAVRRSIVEPLAGLLVGGGSGGGGGWFGSLLNAGAGLLGGSSAVNMKSGSIGGLDVMGSLATPSMDIIAKGLTGASAKGAAGASQVEIVPSPYFDARVREQAAPGAVQAGVASYQASEAQRMRDVRISKYRRG